MSTKPLSLALAPRTRQPVAPRTPRAEYKSPHVRKDEVAIAAGILANYKIEGVQAFTDEEIEEIEEIALRSRDSSRALVQIAWAMAQVEKDAFNEIRWFHKTWMPEMKEAQANGEKMAEETEEGDRVRLSNAQRNVLICSIGPMFGTGLSDELIDAVRAAIVGPQGSHLRMSLEILRVANKIESIDEVVKIVKAEAAASPAPEAEAESDNDSDDAEVEAPAAASA